MKLMGIIVDLAYIADALSLHAWHAYCGFGLVSAWIGPSVDSTGFVQYWTTGLGMAFFCWNRKDKENIVAVLFILCRHRKPFFFLSFL